MIATRFSIVPTLARTAVIAEDVRYGFSHRCRHVCATGAAVLELERTGSRARARAIEKWHRAREQDRIGAIVLGCAGMADLAQRAQHIAGIPVIDGVDVCRYVSPSHWPRPG